MNDLLRPEMLVSMWLWSSLSVMVAGGAFALLERRFGAGRISLACYALLGFRLLLPLPAPWGALPASPVWSVLAVLLLAGALAMTARLMWLSWATYRRALREEIAVPERASAVFVEARRCIGLHSRPVFLFTDAPFPAMVIGVIRPLVVMPRRAALCPPEELKHVVYHELTHLKKGDLVMNTFWQIAVALHWFNPVAKWMARRRRFHAEARCDELSCRALGGSEAGRVAYSRTLVEMAERAPLAEGALCLSESEYNLTARVERLLTPPRRAAWPVPALASMALLVVATVAPLFTLTAQEAPAETESRLAPPPIEILRPIVPPSPPRIEFPAGKPVPERPMQTREMAVSARITGLHAEVETTLTFFNPNNRQLEGDLVFPLPDGAVVSGYALDINGTLVDGVVVKKEKARVAFEAETRRQVDPGIVEHVKGNIYRTRIYPLPPNSARIVKLRYVTELAADSKGDLALAVGLPREAIGKLKLSVRVDNPGVTPEVGGFGNLRFARIENAWLAETVLENATPGSDLLVALPKLPKTISALERDAEGNTYFMLSDLPVQRDQAPSAKRALDTLAVAWDASGSRSDADRAKELAFLETLAAQSGAKRFKLCIFRDRPEAIRTFERFSDLKAAIEAAPCDGGTDFAALTEALEEGDWFLLTDGLDTLGEKLPEAQAKFTGVTSQSTGDREALRQLCSGSVIDLQRLAPGEAAALALAPPFRVSGIEGRGIAAVQGIGAAVRGRVILTGRLTAPSAELRIVYSDGTRSDTFRLVADRAGSGALLATVWAASRVTHLSARAEENEEELLTLGQRFGLVSPATSLIVLEDLAQYLRHEIRPPEQLADMRRQWDETMARKGKTNHDAATAKLDRMLALWQRRVDWWEGKITPPKDKQGDDSFVPFGSEADLRAMRAQRASPRASASVSSPMAPDSLPAVQPPSLDVLGGSLESSGSALGVNVVNGVDRGSIHSSGVANYRGVDTGGEISDLISSKPSGTSSVGRTARVKITAWDAGTPYLKRIRSAAQTGREAVYLEERKTYAASPAFFLDCADFFLNAGERELGLRILSNLAELRIEDAALLRVFAWRLQQAGQVDRAVSLLRRVTRLRPEDPQSWRDLALALAERGKRDRSSADLTEAQAFYKKVILETWSRPGEIELFALEELNALMDWITRADWEGKPALIDLDTRLRKNLDTDLRIVMVWDADATDMDLHVVEPSGEEAYYGHRHTSINGLVSFDVTDGYGPEEYVLRKAPAGTYTVKSKYFASRQQTVMGPATLFTRIYTDWGRPGEACQTLTFRLNTGKEMVEIGRVAIGDSKTVLAPDAGDFAEFTIGMLRADVEKRIGRPGRTEGDACFYTRGSRQWKLLFADGKLVRVIELLPGGAEMIVVQ